MKYGFDYHAPLRKRLALAWGLIKGEPVAYHIGVHGTGIFVQESGSIVGCEIRPEGFGTEAFEVPADPTLNLVVPWGDRVDKEEGKDV